MSFQGHPPSRGLSEGIDRSCFIPGHPFVHAVCAKPSHRLVSVCQLVPDWSKIDEDQRAENR